MEACPSEDSASSRTWLSSTTPAWTWDPDGIALGIPLRELQPRQLFLLFLVQVLCDELLALPDHRVDLLESEVGARHTLV